ncbi:Quinone oxidoreductase 2, partial [Lachnellula arida]
MPKYVLTGVGGHIGSIAADYAIEIARPDQKLTFTTMKTEKIPEESLTRWKAAGVEVLTASYDEPDSLASAFRDAESVNLISTWLLGDTRRRQHKAVIDTAKACGVKKITYTSFTGAGLEKDLPFLPQDHKYTEGLIYARETKIVNPSNLISGLEYRIQRNYLYANNVPTLFAPSWKFCDDKWTQNSGETPGAYVAREDCGRVHAALLLGHGEPNTVYNISGPEAVTDKAVMEYICKKTGYKCEIQAMTDEELDKYWTEKGLPRTVFEDFSKLPMKLCIPDL